MSRNVFALLGAFLLGHWGDFLVGENLSAGLDQPKRVFTQRTVDRGLWNGSFWEKVPRLMVLRKWKSST